MRSAGNEDRREIYLAVDGGGSKTLARAVRADGRTVKELIGPGTNPYLVGAAEAQRRLLSLTDALAVEIGLRDHTDFPNGLLCLAGNTEEFLRDCREAFPAGRFAIKGDFFAGLYLVGDGRPAYLIHGGTGALAASLDERGGLQRFGGHGYRLGDPGSGADLGARALRITLQAAETSAGVSDLGRLVLDTWNIATADRRVLLETLYKEPEYVRELGKLGRLVIEQTEKGDCLSARLLKESLGELVNYLVPSMKVFHAGQPAACWGVSGPVLTHRCVIPVLCSLLEEKGPTGLSWKTVTEAPIEGVVRALCAQIDGSGTCVGLTTG